ncbi:MAG: hypothetical protein CME26_12985 [Gemmatimonadetes bacterium]|nr:hypothetical protein [Gemmatimonadota bacterium]|tara:strand:- start:2455 stop:2718 length:264 start_codon:yes stop_codon:yes gene_type:complete
MIIAGCASTHSYQTYLVVHDLSTLQTGEEVRIVLKGGETMRGTVKAVALPDIEISTFDRGDRKINRASIHVAERIVRTRFSEPPEGS